MKRLEELSNGVFAYSNGMIGTRDLPAFVAETAYFRKRNNKKQQMLLDNIKAGADTRPTWREQLAKVAKKLKF